MTTRQFQFLCDLLEWNGLSQSHWLLYKNDCRIKKVLEKYKSKKSHLSQELKLLLKAVSLVRFKKIRKISGDFAGVHSKNQHAALNHLNDRLDFQLVSFGFVNRNVNKLHLTPLSFFALLLFITKNFQILRGLTHKKYHYHQLKVLIYGLILDDHVDFSNIKNVFVSNDHHPETRILLYFRKHNDFQLIYKQHAQVSIMFPPLDWDQAILDGAVAHEQYRINGAIRSKVWITGSDKTADLVTARRVFDHKKVGVAINSLDDLVPLAHYLHKIQTCYDIDRFLVRMHPALNDHDYFSRSMLNSGTTVKFQLHTGDLVDYLSQISVCIAGSSSVLLEAAISKKLCVQHNFVPEDFIDYYKFEYMNAAISHVDFLNLGKVIPDWKYLIDFQTRNARAFSASLGTDVEGKELNEFLISLSQTDRLT